MFSLRLTPAMQTFWLGHCWSTTLKFHFYFKTLKTPIVQTDEKSDKFVEDLKTTFKRHLLELKCTKSH